MRTKLLLADDSITIQKVVGIIFAGEEYELAIVDNGSAALAKAREFKPDLLLVDAVMPGKSGYEVCEEVRNEPALKGVPILLLTGAFEPFDDEKARQCGADDFISKPFESQHLIDKVTELAELGRQRVAAAPAPAAEVAEPLTAPAIAAPVGQPVAESPFVVSLEPESVQTTTPAAAPDFDLEIVEGTTEDDLWGAFDLDDVAEGEAAEFDESAFAVEHLAEGEPVAGETFDFADEPAAAPQESEDVAEGFAASWDTTEDSGFSFEEEVPSGFAPDAAEPDEFAFETGESVEQDMSDIKPYAPPAEQEFDLQFAPEEEAMPASEAPPGAESPAPPAEEGGFDLEFPPDEDFLSAGSSLAGAAAAPAAAVAAPPVAAPEPLFAPEGEYVPTPAALAPASATAAPAPDATGAALSEEQLATLVARISREIIEKIAWEVVPDLAETIIKEEIRKIKEGA